MMGITCIENKWGREEDPNLPKKKTSPHIYLFTLCCEILLLYGNFITTDRKSIHSTPPIHQSPLNHPSKFPKMFHHSRSQIHVSRQVSRLSTPKFSHGFRFLTTVSPPPITGPLPIARLLLDDRREEFVT